MANKVEITIEGNNVTAIKAINGVETKLDGLKGKTKGIGSGIGNLADSLGLNALNVSVGAVVAGIGVLIKNTIETADEFAKMSQRTGVSVESLSTLKYAADLAGVSMEGLDNGFRKFNSNIYDASLGMETSKEAFDALNISIKNNDGTLKSTETLMMDVADRFKDMNDGARKAALAQDLFGKSGTNLIPLLNSGSDGIQSLQSEARRLGLEMTTNTAKAAEEFNDNLTRLGYAVSGIGVQLASELLPSLVAISSSMVTVTQDGQSLQTVAQGIGVALKVVMTLAGGVASALLVYAQAVGTYGAVIGKIVTLSWGEIDDVIKIGMERIKQTSLSAGAGFKALWQDASGYQEMLAKLNAGQREQDALGEQTRKAKALHDQWLGIADTLKSQIMSAGLSPQAVKLLELNRYAEGLREKFNGIAGATQLINSHLQTMIEKNFGADPREMFAPKTEMQITPAIDQSRIDSYKQSFLNVVSDISNESMAHFQIMEMAGTNIFGSMGDSLMEFATLSENTNKGLFQAAKGFSIAQAIMNTYEGATKALGQGGFFGFAMAAAVITSGLAQVARIASTQPSSRGGGGGGISRPSLPSDSVRSMATTNNNQRSVNFSLVINSEVLAGTNLDKWVRENLSGSIKRAVDDGTINFGGGD
jgi:hypothetical protein